MALSQEDKNLMLRHLARFQQQSGCPVCHTATWHMHGPIAWPILDREDGQLSLGMEAIPVVVLRCATCSFMRPFAWQPIKDKADGNG